VSKGKGGRPRKAVYALRRRVICVKLTVEEFERVCRRAARHKLKRAVFVRRVALGKTLPRAVPEVNRETYYQLARMAGCLNVWTRKVRAGERPEEEGPEIEAIRELLRQVKREVVGSDS